MISLLGLLTNCRSVYMETLYLLALVPRFRLIFAIIIIRYLLVHQHFSMLPHNLLVQLWVEYGVRCPTLTHGLAMDFVMRFVGRTVGQCRTCASTSAQGRAMEFAMQPVGATIGRVWPRCGLTSYFDGDWGRDKMADFRRDLQTHSLNENIRLFVWISRFIPWLTTSHL